jgi:Putative Flp pilus-assembly TadE/G-like
LNRRGQVTVGLLAAILPTLVLAAIAVLFVAVRANSERAQRLADAAALQAAIMPSPVVDRDLADRIGLVDGSTLELLSREGVVTAHVQLPIMKFWIPLAKQTVIIAPDAWSSARAVMLDDGEMGAVRVDQGQEYSLHD